MSGQSNAEVFDLGYQYYDGPREGRSRARQALYVNGLRTALGIGRGPLAKVLAISMFGAAIAPAVIMALVAALIEPLADELPTHSDYYELISIILFLFAAIIGPELLCPDRRNGVISLYLVRPMTPTDYVAARWLALFTVIIALVYSGQLVLLAGLVLSASDPAEYLRENWLDIPRILGAGLVVALFLATIPLAVAAFTDRRAYAAAFVIGVFIISAIVAGSLTACVDDQGAGECEPVTGGAAKWLTLVSVGEVPTRVNDIIFDKENNPGLDPEDANFSRDLPLPVPILWWALVTAGPAFLLWRRYNRMVT
jgi:ABC-2 type transport system permease protein